MKRPNKILKFIGVRFTPAMPHSLQLDHQSVTETLTTCRGIKCRLVQNSALTNYNDTIAVRGARKNLQDQIDAISAELVRTRESLDRTQEIQRLLKAYEATVKEGRYLSVKVDAANQISSDIKRAIGDLSGAECTLAESISELHASKIDSGCDIVLSGITVKTDVQPKHNHDVTNKEYVDNIAFGIRWAKEVQVCTSHHIDLTGLFEIDGYTLVTSDRVLVKDQEDRSENGVYFASPGSWTKIAGQMYSAANTGIFVQHGTENHDTCWVRLSTAEFAKISNPVTPSFGVGFKQGGTEITLDSGAGISIDSVQGVSVAIHSAGGLMYTVDNKSPVSKISLDHKVAKLALSKTGVVKGTYGSNTSMCTSISVDDTGRITNINTIGPVTPSFDSITGLPSTLDGYGIDDALSISGGTLTGSLQFSGGAKISNIDTPAINTASLSTSRYGIGGDKRTHLGYNEDGAFMNYIRGARSEFEGDICLTAPGAQQFSFSRDTNKLHIKQRDSLFIIDGTRGAAFAPTSKTDGFSLSVLKQMFSNMSVDLQNIQKYAPDSVIVADGRTFIDLMFVLRCLPGIIQDK